MAEGLEVRGLHRSFGGLVVAAGIGFSLEPGARTALIGPNGAGKTTLVNLITGALASDAGEILLDGRAITALSQAARARRGIVRTFQVGRLFRDQSVADNLRLPVLHRRGAGFRPLPSRQLDTEVDAEVDGILGMLHLRGEADRIAGTLAYGQQRLVEIAIALASRPRVLLLDEPAAGVPQGESGIILDVIGRLPTELAVLLIEHDMDLVFRFADRILVMANGALLCEGSPAEIAANDEVSEIYFGRDGRDAER